MMRQKLQTVIKDYVLDPVQQQELLVDFLLVYLDLRPAFFLEDKHASWGVAFDFQKNPEFIQRIETLGFIVVIGPFYDNHSTISVIINPKRAKTVLRKLEQIRKMDADDPRKHKYIGQVLGYDCAGEDFLNYSVPKLDSQFIFIKNGIQTVHLAVWCPIDNLKKDLPTMLQRLYKISQIPEFRDFKIELRHSFIHLTP